MPVSHRLSLLAKKTLLWDLFSEDQKEFIDMLEPMNIEARYPTHKELLLKSLTKARCTEILKETEKLQLWIKKKLSFWMKLLEIFFPQDHLSGKSVEVLMTGLNH